MNAGASTYIRVRLFDHVLANSGADLNVPQYAGSTQVCIYVLRSS
jgi:hypothetical protein